MEVLDFSRQNKEEREYFKKDFSPINELIQRIRQSLETGEPISTADLALNSILEFNPDLTFIYITLFQAGSKLIRWGCYRKTLNATLDRNIEQIRKHPRFQDFEINNSEKCRIMIEYMTEETPVRIEDIQTESFDQNRFEPGITGIKLEFDDQLFVYMPTESIFQGRKNFEPILNSIIQKTRLKDLAENANQGIALLKQSVYKCYLIKSRAFVSYKNELLPLYRGSILQEYSPELIKEVALNGAEWIYKNQQPSGQFLYYYNCKDDDYIDVEHPTRKPNNLYYNELRHCGGIVALIRAYQLTKNKKYLECSKKALDYVVAITKEHTVDNKKAAYLYLNKKAKLGGTGLALTAMMLYRIEAEDKSYDKYIKRYVRHILSRIFHTGEMLGYYIHPKIQGGEPLTDMTQEERRETFSFYYPGEALLGLGLFANYFEDSEKLVKKVIEKSKFALDWLMEERPKYYSDLFTSLPSDSWLMQAIEEWCTRPDFRKESYTDFVFNDARTMMNKMYQKDNSPYIDYEGGFFYTNYGDLYYPDGSRSEGLIAACYLAKKLGNKELTEGIQQACRKAALAQTTLYNSEKTNFPNKNQEKSFGAIRSKITRRWARVDSVQHVVCPNIRLYFAENNIESH